MNSQEKLLVLAEMLATLDESQRRVLEDALKVIRQPDQIGAAAEDEALVAQAAAIIIRDRKTSISYLQRRMGIGYNKTDSLMKKLEMRGVVGAQIGNGPREILIDRTSIAKETTGDRGQRA